MAALKTNRVIPLMVIAFVCMAGFVFFKASKPSGAKPLVVNSGQWMRKAPTPQTADADTSNDTIRAIRGQVTAANSQADETLAMNRSLIEKLDTVMSEKDEIEESQETLVQQQLTAQSVQNQRQFDVMMSRMSEMVDKIGTVPAPSQQVVIASADKQFNNENQMDIPDGFGVNIEAGQFVSGEDLIEVFWIEPLDESINNRVRGATGSSGTISVSNSVQNKTDNLVSTGENAKALLMKPLDTYRDLVDSAAEGPGILGKAKDLRK